MNSPQLHPGAVQDELARLTELLERTTEAYARQAELTNAAEVEWKRAEAVSLAESCTDKKPEYLRKAEAMVNYGHLFADWRTKLAVQDGLTEKCRTLRTAIESLRTISANLRGQV